MGDVPGCDGIYSDGVHGAGEPVHVRSGRTGACELQAARVSFHCNRSAVLGFVDLLLPVSQHPVNTLQQRYFPHPGIRTGSSGRGARAAENVLDIRGHFYDSDVGTRSDHINR